MDLQKMKSKICLIAAFAGYRHIKTQEWCINFEKLNNGERTAMNVYWNQKQLNKLNTSLQTQIVFTVQTAINHPKKGRTQLNRQGITFPQLEHLFSNPRQHTGKGYY